MHADTTIHAQSFLQLHTGDRLRERPSLGSWVTYGLGTENQNLPGFISLNTSKSFRLLERVSPVHLQRYAHWCEW